MQRSAHGVVIAGGVVVLAAAEWVRSGGALGWGLVAAAAGAVAAAAALLVRPRVGPRVMAGAAAFGLAGLVLHGALDVRGIECCWARTLRERRVIRASAALAGRLAQAVAEARRLAARGAAAAALPREEGFRALAADVGVRPALERGVVVLDAAGEPWIWAGRHRAVPGADTSELRAVITSFYVLLEARRQTDGGSVVGSVLIAATPPPIDPHAAVASAFAAAHGVAVRVTTPGGAPAGGDVFDYGFDAGRPGGNLLFSVQLAPPGQGEAKLAALRTASTMLLLALGITVLVLLVAAPPGWWRWAVLGAGTWALGRGAPGAGTRLAELFSPATFYRTMLGDFSASAPALTAVAFVVLVAGWALWRRGLRRRLWAVAAAALLILAAPYLVRYLARGIAPPAAGVGLGLWLSWQAVIAVSAMALVVWAAALVRGPVEPRRVPWTLPAACVWAALAALVGLWLWAPYGAWPEWYPFLWVPALGGVVLPAPRRAAIVGLAVVAGTAAALVTWGAALEGRLQLASRDVARLGREGDPVAVALLERLGAQAVRGPGSPRSAGELYRFWLESPLAAQDYPAVLALWTPDGALRAELRLAALDLPLPLLAVLARAPDAGVRVERMERVPGVHYVLATALPSGDRLTVGVGPRSRLLAPDRVARFLQGAAAVEPPFAISLSLPDTASAPPPSRYWRRAGWAALGEQRLDLPGGLRHVHVRVDLRRPWTLAVRGALVVLVDLMLLALAWVVARVVTEGWRPRPGPLMAQWRTAYRARLTAALAAFFGAPVLAFALWSFARLGDEARRAGDLLIQQVLRDAAVTAGGVALDQPATLGREVVDLGRRLDADLWLYRGPRLAGTSAPVLDELGLVDGLLDAEVFRRLGLEDELELAADGRTAGRPIRIGYRLVRSGPPESQGVLAAPQLLDDERVRRQQIDLALVLLLVTVGGLGAAVLLAGLVARGLERPVAALRDAAVAVGRGAPLPQFPDAVPREFGTVVAAFQRMAGDVRRSQVALEEARARMARVLANVATAVIAVDEGLRVTLANPRAAELLGTALEPGDALPRAVGGAWQPVWDTVAGFLKSGSPGRIDEHEFEIDGRQIRAQLAPLGPGPGGCVVALDDTTDLSRAARVLAWGEMARQVAHEIKNPLTPIRLGVQHLRRARSAEHGGDFDRTLAETSDRILVEIDRLDAIARAFSRFGAPTEAATPLEPVSLLGAAQEVAQLYSLGGRRGSGARVTVTGHGGGLVLARRDEVREVLLNLLENARAAGAGHVRVVIADDGATLTVSDDGPGIPAEVLPRVFEPTFSTTSSGSGLGLAIARRLVESWRGAITLTSEPGRGTTVTLALRPAG